MIEETLKDYIINPEKNRCTDIFEHLNTLKTYASECNHVTEMGVRWGASTVAFLNSRPQKMISYDITTNNAIKKIISMAESEEVNFSFVESDSLKINIETTDLLFIDTLHTYNQLYSELLRHHKQVKKYIILHDTTSFSRVDEGMYHHASEEVKKMPRTKTGLRTAMEDFLSEFDEWVVDNDFTNNNGLTILSRI